ncbi:hypothetical protein AB6A40_004863 [Gnathostoma spinigerum]|uniref:Adenosine 3'-phospho 5'-phosphosulfate transporter 2 n=1 Tax=Gnathostoma spinigerum TaxID=75299 RepID=A0ABD6ELG7_9BILA
MISSLNKIIVITSVQLDPHNLSQRVQCLDKRYGWIDWITVCLMSFGLAMFTLADNQVAPNFEPRGYVMLLTALTADAAIGNIQEKALCKYGATVYEMVLYSYFLGFFVLLFGTTLSGEFFDGIAFFSTDAKKYYGSLILLSFLGYCGVNVVLSLVRSWGALTAVTVTTMRKAVTIAVSFLFFTKPFTVNYVWSGLIVLFAIYLDLLNKNCSKTKIPY